jgi:hypothetical protein
MKLLGDVIDELYPDSQDRLQSSRDRLSIGQCTVMLCFRGGDRRLVLISEDGFFVGLLGRVLHDFLFLADFMTNDRTTLSGFALTPPLLESMNMNCVACFV